MILSDADRARIVEAIREAEMRTSGEIYCVDHRSFERLPLCSRSPGRPRSRCSCRCRCIYLTSWPALGDLHAAADGVPRHALSC